VPAPTCSIFSKITTLRDPHSGFGSSCPFSFVEVVEVVEVEAVSAEEEEVVVVVGVVGGVGLETTGFVDDDDDADNDDDEDGVEELAEYTVVGVDDGIFPLPFTSLDIDCGVQ